MRSITITTVLSLSLVVACGGEDEADSGLLTGVDDGGPLTGGDGGDGGPDTGAADDGAGTDGGTGDGDPTAGDDGGDGPEPGDTGGSGDDGGGTGCGPSNGAGGPTGENEMPVEGHPNAWMYAPPDPGQAMPLIVSLHGSGDDAYNFNYLFLGAAQQNGMLLVTPEASDPSGWSETDDVIIFAAIDAMKDRHNVDTCRIYVAGFSAGAHYSFIVGLQNSEMFAGIGSIQGAIQYAESWGIWPDMVTRKIAVDIEHGTYDGAYQAAEYSRDVLEAAGHPVYWHPLDGVGHEADPAYAANIISNLKNHSLEE